MKTLLSILFNAVLLFTFSTSFAQAHIPKSEGEIIKHSYYTLSYSEKHEQPIWVSYTLDYQMINGPGIRKDNFRADPKVSTGSSTKADYTRSGYDRGHLCPAASMTISQEAIDESFYMSNMSPQHPQLNRLTWAHLEEDVRGFVLTEQNIEVVTGPIFEDIKGYIGNNRVSIPGYFYKIVYAPSSQKMIAYILPNEKPTKKLNDYIVSVDKVEEVTGIDFFHTLPDELENKLEASSDHSLWNFQGFSRTNIKKATTSTENTDGVDKEQCKGVTKAGTRCKRTVSAGEEYCYQHKEQ